jgi:hypothetical protein
MLAIIDSVESEILNIFSLDEHNFIFARVVIFVVGRNFKKLEKGVTTTCSKFQHVTPMPPIKKLSIFHKLKGARACLCRWGCLISRGIVFFCFKG